MNLSTPFNVIEQACCCPLCWVCHLALPKRLIGALPKVMAMGLTIPYSTQHSFEWIVVIPPPFQSATRWARVNQPTVLLDWCSHGGWCTQAKLNGLFSYAAQVLILSQSVVSWFGHTLLFHVSLYITYSSNALQYFSCLFSYLFILQPSLGLLPLQFL